MSDFLELPIPIRLTNPKPVDSYYGPYPSLAAAYAGVPLAVRYDGQTVRVTGLGEYNWLAGDLSDAGLVPKAGGAAGPGYTDDQARAANDARFDLVEADVSQLEGDVTALDNRVDDLELSEQADFTGARLNGSSLVLVRRNGTEVSVALPPSDPGQPDVTGLDYNETTGLLTVTTGTTTFTKNIKNIPLALLADDLRVLINGKAAKTYVDTQDAALGERLALIEGAVPAGAGPADLLVKTSDLAGLGGGNVNLVGITEFLDRFPVNFTGNLQQFAERLLIKYQAPSFTSFSLDDVGTVTREVGTDYATGAHTFKWGTGNAAQVAANSLVVRDVTAAQNAGAGLANDGNESLPLTGFRVNNGLSRTYRISGQDTKGNPFSTELTISGSYGVFFGPTTGVPAGSAQVRNLDGKRLASDGNSFVLNTGGVQRFFALWLPPGKALLSVVDQDSLNADITSQYLPQALNVNDAAGTAVAGTLYVMTQAVPYTTNHRHLIATT